MSKLSWRRDPIGAGLSIMGHRNKRALAIFMTRPDLMELSLHDFEDALRADGCSEAMIKREVAEFKKLKDQQSNPAMEIAKRREARRQEQVENVELSPYVEAEIRRSAGIVAEDVIEELKRGKNA